MAFLISSDVRWEKLKISTKTGHDDGNKVTWLEQEVVKALVDLWYSKA